MALAKSLFLAGTMSGAVFGLDMPGVPAEKCNNDFPSLELLAAAQ